MCDKIPPENLEYVKSALLETFTDSSNVIRSSIANAITALFVKIGFSQWPELLSYFSGNLNQHNPELVLSSLECIAKILEDLGMESENFNYFEEKTGGPLTELIPQLISMCDPQYANQVRELALHSLNLFTSMMPPSFLANMNNYFQILFAFFQDESAIIRRHVCDGFIKVLEKRKDLITAYLEQVLQVILKLTVDPDNEVRKRACLFWNEYFIVEEGEPLDRIEPLYQYLEQLLEAVIDCLPYTEEDLMALDSKEAKTHGYFNYDEDEDEDEGIRRAADGEDHLGQVTLRKEAGFALDSIVMEFEGEACFKAQAKLEKCLKSENWLIRETGILTLGTLAKGAKEVITEHFATLFPYLKESLSDSQPLVRCIACWTLSRFTKWIVDYGKISQENEVALQTYMIAVLELMMDENSRVQEAACSALSKLCNDGPEFVGQYITDVLDRIKIASEKYSQKEVIKYLYDSIGSLAFNVSQSVLQTESVENALLGIISRKWSESKFDNPEAVCLVECTDTIIVGLGNHAIKYAEFFITRSMLLIFNYIQIRNEDSKVDDGFFQREVATRCFDLLDKFLIVMKDQTQQLLNSNDYRTVFFGCVNDEDVILRQVTLSSANQVAKHCPNLLRDYLPDVAEVLLKNLFYEKKEIDSQGIYMGCCNNAAAAAGDFALAFRDSFKEYIPTFAEKICEILQGKLHKAVCQSLVVAMGKFGVVDPDRMSFYLKHFLKQFCVAIGPISGDSSKEEAFRGLFAMILKNPSGVVENFSFLCVTLVNFENESEDIHVLAREILHEFKAYKGNSWNEFYNQFPSNIREALYQKFGL